MIHNGFILDPNIDLLPDYKISPFSTGDLVKNQNLSDSDSCDFYFRERFKSRDFIYTQNGRTALNQSLQYFDLRKEDCVTILTTTGNYYISSCVTKEIEKFCKWSRKFEKNTKTILVNHEFGYPFQDLLKLKDYNLPIIEDCAHSFFSRDNDNIIGTIGDFVVYSFPKMFPLQIGGLLVSNLSERLEIKDQVGTQELRHLKNVLSNYIGNKENMIQRRIDNYQFLKKKFESLGFTERFQLDNGIVPGVFMFSTVKLKMDLPELKKYFYAHGVQCSVFYGEEAFFIPVHQALNEQDMLYFYEVMKSFMLKSGI